jgi:hypothetical protein
MAYVYILDKLYEAQIHLHNPRLLKAPQRIQSLVCTYFKCLMVQFHEFISYIQIVSFGAQK